MVDFIPPFPPRPDRVLSGIERIALARQNLVGMWEEAAFRWRFQAGRILNHTVVVCNDPETVQFAFGTHNASFERKSREMRQILEPLIGDGLFISDGEVWRKRRRLIAPILHASRLPHYAPAMVEAALEMRARWADQSADAPIDVLKEMGQLTAEIICRTLFGRTLGRAHTREIVEGFADYQRAVEVASVAVTLNLPEWLSRRRTPPLAAAIRRIDSVLDQVFGDLKAGAADSESSLVGQLMRAGEDGQRLTEQQARNEACVLFMAGYETTASTLAWVWFLLSQDPKVEARLHGEIDTVLAGRAPTIDDVPGLVWTRAIIEETLRLYPPVPILSREAVKAEVLHDTKIPKGATLLVVPWLLHRHKKLWVKPDQFKPQRFLPSAPHGPISKYAYVPFSVGPRVCPGRSFGLTETILCVATLAQGFQLRLQSGHKVEPSCRMTLRPGHVLPMMVARRTASPPAADAAATPPRCPLANG